MAQISYTLSASDLTRSVNAICSLANYQSTIDGVSNPETKNQFALRKLKEWIQQNVKEYEKRADEQTNSDAFESSFVKPDIT